MQKQVTRGIPHSDYLVIFFSFIFGYVVFEFLSGWAEIIRNLKLGDIYWIHLAWTVLAFILVVQSWWGMWAQKELIAAGFGSFFFTLIIPILYYFLSIVLFPSINRIRDSGYEMYFFGNKHFIFGVLAIIIAYLVLNDYCYLNKDIRCRENKIRIPAIVFLTVLAVTGNIYCHILLMLSCCFLLLYFIIRFRVRLSS